jgi:hypothetical protein
MVVEVVVKVKKEVLDVQQPFAILVFEYICTYRDLCVS